MTTKIKNLEIHEGNYNRRVRYNDKKEFDVLIVNLNDGYTNRSFQIDAKHLPETDSIHLKYDPISHNVSWSPKEIISHVVEVR